MDDAEILFFKPCEKLLPLVRYYYVLKSQKTFSTLTFPLGCSQIIFHKGTPLFIPELNSRQSIFTISGQVNFPTHVSTSEDTEMVVAVFHPHTIGLFIDTPPSSFYNLEISGYDIGNKDLSELAARIFDCGDNSHCVRMIEHRLLTKLSDASLSNCTRIGATIKKLMEYPSIPITALADTACLCKKQFERVFSRCVGMQPKEYARVVRFQKSLRFMQNGHYDDTDIVYECGFADQSHFIREFKNFSGHTPRGLQNVGCIYSDLFTNPLIQAAQ